MSDQNWQILGIIVAFLGLLLAPYLALVGINLIGEAMTPHFYIPITLKSYIGMALVTSAFSYRIERSKS